LSMAHWLCVVVVDMGNTTLARSFRNVKYVLRLFSERIWLSWHKLIILTQNQKKV
jgi:hypothetical protein